MIALLGGTVADVSLDEVVVLVSEVGWRVHVAPSFAQELSVGAEVTMHTSMVVREDSMTLFGFRSRDERIVFERLQTVSGIGPRIALAALTVLSPDDLRRAVASNDLAALQRIPGVGRKSAQRMVLEIGDKLGVVADLPTGGAAPAGPASAAQAEVRAALVQLGWTEAVADKTLAFFEGENLNAPDLLRAALRALGGAGGR